jgi:hypothetical protein
VFTGQPERVRVVPLLGLVVVHQGEGHAVPLLEGGPAGLDRIGGVADHDRDVREPHRGEVAQRDVQDRGLAVDGDQRLRERVGVRAQPAASSGGEYQADHRALLPRGFTVPSP